MGGPTPSDEDMVHYAIAAANTDAESINEADWSRYGVSVDEMHGMVKTAMNGWFKDIAPVIDTYTPVAVEPYFRSDLLGVADIHGYIDWLGRDADGQWAIIDFKTASSFSRWPATMTGLNIEAAVYLAGAVYSNVLPPDETVRMEWHVMKTKGDPSGRVVVGPTFDAELLHFLAEKVAYAEQIVQEKSFQKNTGWNLCSQKWCPYYHGCEVSGVLAPENVNLYPETEMAATVPPLAGAARPSGPDPTPQAEPPEGRPL